MNTRLCAFTWMWVLVSLALGWAAAVPGYAGDAGDLAAVLERMESAAEAEDYGELETLLEEASLLVWNLRDLEVRQIMHVERAPRFYGDAVERDHHRYAAGDTLRLYIEPRNYTIALEAGEYAIHLKVGVKMVHEEGAVVYDEPDFLDYPGAGIRPMKEFYVDMSFDLGPGIPEGSYSLEVFVTDQMTGEEVTAETGFQFEH